MPILRWLEKHGRYTNTLGSTASEEKASATLFAAHASPMWAQPTGQSPDGTQSCFRHGHATSQRLKRDQAQHASARSLTSANRMNSSFRALPANFAKHVRQAKWQKHLRRLQRTPRPHNLHLQLQHLPDKKTKNHTLSCIRERRMRTRRRGLIKILERKVHWRISCPLSCVSGTKL